MSVVVSYPVTVVRYQVSIGRDSAILALDGVEGPASASTPDEKSLRRVGKITFEALPSEEQDFISRGGYLYMWRPLTMLAGILELLRHVKPCFLNENGTLSTSWEPVDE